MPDKYLAQLQQLPCFTVVEQIDPITTGLSQPSYRVFADHKHYFAKYVAQPYLSDEFAISQITAKENLSPRIIYRDKHWLISEFIRSKDIYQTTQPLVDSISNAVTLMTRFHQLSVPCEPLDVTAIYNGLIKSKQNHYSSQHLALFQQLIATIKINTDATSKQVNCHGDLNFNNILMDEAGRNWLIDFECSCKAPAEFDIAMLVAVNELPHSHITAITKQYLAEKPQNTLSLKVINYFLLFSYLINSLWYNNKRITEQEYGEKFAVLAKAQWKNLQTQIIKMELPLDSSILTKLI
ncbi:phosphotransferase [Litorilituus lipolyticus]|uniref:Aminoglycoside phosphotransferase domain-containing protein n=1 Tax=Litorilituus lipolyticus TaxID=2491017 RepID=A0A502KYN6_9GAMM|nr:phosphotransferase [Litorilituus lipolyticus]TPH13337.1 hypothetical protein EPA86_14190 [Litorilituus lipolyticus]